MISALLVAPARRNYRCMVTKEPTLKHRMSRSQRGIADALTNPGSATVAAGNLKTQVSRFQPLRHFRTCSG